MCITVNVYFLVFGRNSNGTVQSLVAQQTTNLNIWFNVSNRGDSAFATVLTFFVPKSQLYFVRCEPNLVSVEMGYQYADVM